MFDPSELIRGAWTIGSGPKEYGLYLANRPNKKFKGWQKNNKKNRK